MQVSELMIEGVNLMLLGMGSVFLFLSILVLALSGVARLSNRFATDDDRDSSRPPTATPRAATESEEIIAVITAAISRYRQR
ncbi:MAG: OadG family protein [Sedimenticola sp.]|nr:OadG family protein [Sedimenticola sp.]